MTTINDIANMANVSTSTVSHVVNKTRYVSPELAERVEKAIRELEHPPNFVVKKANVIPPKKTTKYILLIISNKKSNFQKQIEHKIEQNLKGSGYSLLTFSSGEEPQSTKTFFLNLLGTGTISGVILFSDEQDFFTQEVLSSQRLPAVILGDSSADFLADTIISDTADGAYKAVKHLVQNGHEHIAFIGNSGEAQSKRLQGYQKALEDYGIEYRPSYVYPALHNESKIFSALDALFSGYTTPSALFVANYSVIIPILKYIDSHNIACPNDVSIVSFNDFEWAPLLTPPITTIEQRADEFGKLATETIISRIERGEPANSPALRDSYKEWSLTTKINVRESTCGIGRGPFGEKAESPSSLTLSDAEMAEIRGKKLTAAISFHYAGKAWMELHLKGIKEIFDNLGISLIATTDAHFDPELQCKQLDSLRTLEPDIIIAMPTDNEKTSEAFLRIAASPSKLIFISIVPDGLTPGDYVTCVSVNERSHGRNMGHGLGDYMLRHGLNHLALIMHDANFYATRQRDSAAEQVINEEYPEFIICGKLLFKAEDDVYKKTLALLNRHPEIEALYVSWDGPAAKVMAALSELGRTDVCIVTGDLDHADALNMAKGGMIKMISAQCPYEQGQAIAMAAANASLEKTTPPFIGIEPISVTPDNLLKSWKRVFKEEPSPELRQTFHDNPNYIFIEGEK